MKTIALGSDPNAAGLKEILKKHIIEMGYEWKDYGSDDPIYANVAFDVAQSVASGKHERGILMCGTGIGMSIAANKVSGVRAALCSDAYSAERAVKSNNANIMTLGSQVTGPELAKSLVKVWLESRYETGTRSEPKVQRIDKYDQNRK
jgi:ribose 5-phosphate isomerase B